jgi:succinyl-CoA:acetate CoA-transferase
MEYLDMHLSHVAQAVWEGFLGHLDIAVVEVTAIRDDGQLVPSSSVGNNKTWLDCADRVILEVNSWQPRQLEGMHDIYYGTRLPPQRRPIPIISVGDRIGTPYFNCDPDKIIAIVETNAPDRNSTFSPPDDVSRQIAGHIMEFLEHEIHKGRLTPSLLPLQSGVGNIANAVMGGLAESRFEELSAYTEVLQDGMLHLLDSGKLTVASTTALALSPAATKWLYGNLEHYRSRIILRPQEISNHPEVIRRLGCLAMNGIIEADIYGNVNSTHLMGTSIQNGIGGSGDFARNAYISFFMTPSTAKGGDHTEHDVNVIVTEQGLADLRGLSPKQRAEQIIEHCAHPDMRPALRDYFRRAMASSSGKHTPHLLDEALSWHLSYMRDGQMPPAR